MGSLLPHVQHQKTVSDVPYLLHCKEDARGCASLSGKEVNLRGRHRAVSVENQRGLEKGSAPEDWGYGAGHSPELLGAQGAFGHSSQTYGLDIGWSYVEPRVGLNDPRGSSPTPDILSTLNSELAVTTQGIIESCNHRITKAGKSPTRSSSPTIQ